MPGVYPYTWDFLTDRGSPVVKYMGTASTAFYFGGIGRAKWIYCTVQYGEMINNAGYFSQGHGTEGRLGARTFDFLSDAHHSGAIEFIQTL
jgi:hypothetical protein